MALGNTIAGKRYEKFRKQRRKKQLFLVLSIIWAIVLLFFICIANFDGIFHFEPAAFKWNPRPEFSELLIFSDFNLVHHDYVIVKLGHLIGFAIMEFLFYKWCRRKGPAIFFAILLAAVTEVLQLFFWRDGRIYDIMIDSAGVIMSYILVKIKVGFVKGNRKSYKARCKGTEFKK